jgi:hypothetical protein
VLVPLAGFAEGFPALREDDREHGQVQATRLAAGPAVDDLRVEGSMRLEPPGSQARCGFCGNEARRVRHLVASGLAVPAGKFGHLPRICDKCRDLCLEILPRPRLSCPARKSVRGPERTSGLRSCQVRAWDGCDPRQQAAPILG